jgi:hypothetical protein
MVAYVLVRCGGFRVKDVAAYFGRDTTTINSLVSPYERKMQERPVFGFVVKLSENTVPS